jgi:alpha-L-arabinofuranosidase
MQAQVSVRGASVRSGTATVLSASEIHARNTFEQPEALVPKTASVNVRGGAVSFEFPAASVVKLELELA